MVGEIAQEQTGGVTNTADKELFVSSGFLLPFQDRSGRDGPRKVVLVERLVKC